MVAADLLRTGPRDRPGATRWHLERPHRPRTGGGPRCGDVRTAFGRAQPDSTLHRNDGADGGGPARDLRLRTREHRARSRFRHGGHDPDGTGHGAVVVPIGLRAWLVV